MTHDPAHAAAAHTAADADAAHPFPAKQVEQFHSEDVMACKMIVGLMASIFSTGLVLYATVAWICGA